MHRKGIQWKKWVEKGAIMDGAIGHDRTILGLYDESPAIILHLGSFIVSHTSLFISFVLLFIAYSTPIYILTTANTDTDTHHTPSHNSSLATELLSTSLVHPVSIGLHLIYIVNHPQGKFSQSRSDHLPSYTYFSSPSAYLCVHETHTIKPWWFRLCTYDRAP